MHFSLRLITLGFCRLALVKAVEEAIMLAMTVLMGRESKVSVKQTHLCALTSDIRIFVITECSE